MSTHLEKHNEKMTRPVKSTEEEIHSGEKGSVPSSARGPDVKHENSGKDTTICSSAQSGSQWPAIGPH